MRSRAVTIFVSLALAPIGLAGTLTSYWVFDEGSPSDDPKDDAFFSVDAEKTGDGPNGAEWKVLAGAPSTDAPFTYSGRAWLRGRQGFGPSTTTQIDVPPGDATTDGAFGTSVAFGRADAQTDTIEAFITALKRATGGGAAYRYSISNQTQNPSLQQTIAPSDGHAQDRFGTSTSVTTDGDKAVFGAPTAQVGALLPGAAYVFERATTLVGTAFVEVAKLTDPSLPHGVLFGQDVCVSGDGGLVLAGAPLNTVPGATAGSGSVSLFRETSPNVYQLVVTSVPAGLPANANFGDAVCFAPTASCPGGGERVVFYASARGAGRVFQGTVCGGAVTYAEVPLPADWFAGPPSFAGDDLVYRVRQDGSEVLAVSAPFAGAGGEVALFEGIADHDVAAAERRVLRPHPANAGAVYGATMAFPEDDDLFVGAPFPAFLGGLGDVYHYALSGLPGFEAFGAACAPAGNATPTMSAEGGTQAGDAMTLRLEDGPPGTTGLFFIGFGEASVPLGNGCAFPLATVTPLVIPFAWGTGATEISFAIPATLAQTAEVGVVASTDHGPDGPGVTNATRIRLNP